MVTLGYVIRNHKNVYIKLNEKGKPVTCPEHEKGIFEYTKARNIVKSLKKTLQRLNFSVEPVPDTLQAVSDTEQTSDIPHNEEVENIKKNVIEGSDYELSENISIWIEKFGTCSDILNEAKQKREILVDELNKSEDELLDILHKIELEPSKDLYHGWLLYKQIKNNRKKRREMKDEMFIIQRILKKIDPSCLDRKRIRRVVNGLFKRKYTYRILEEEESDDM